MFHTTPLLSPATGRRVNRFISAVMLAGLLLQTVVSFNPVVAQAADDETSAGSEFQLTADTGFLSPTANAENGDGDSWSNPTNAYSDGSGAATDTSGERHRFYNFSFTLPSLGTVEGIEIAADAWSSDASGCRLDMDLSWNGGSNWTSEKQQSLTGSETTYTFGGASDTWGRTWTLGQLSNSNFRVRVQDVDPSGAGCSDDAVSSLDWLRAKVHYTAVDITANPALPTACGLDMALVIDSSSSISTTELNQMKTAYKAFVDAFLPGTPTQMSVVEYDTDVVGSSLAFTNDITAIKNRIDASASSGYTNWEAGLYAAHNQFDPRPAKPDLMLFASDGNPNTTGVNGNSNGGDAGEAAAMAAAIARANAIKADGIRILALGIGDELDVENLKSISGANVNTGITSDVITSSFSTLASDLAEFANDLCGGKILVQKQYDTDGDGDVDVDGSQPNAVLAGWNFDVNGAPSNPAAQTTTNTGSLEFSVLNGTYSVTETALQPNTSLVSAECRLGQSVVGTFDAQTRTVSGLSLTTDQTVSCTFVNQTTSGTLRVVKNVVGGTAQPSDWQIHVQQQGTDVAGSPQAGTPAGTSYSLTPGTYTVSETGGPSGYSLSFSDDCNGQGLVTVPAGGSATCTLTNTRDQGRVKIVKVTSDQSDPTAWTFDIAGNGTVNHDEFITLNTGEYGVTEHGPAGYTLDHVEGICSTGPNGITLHVTANGGTCTVFNRLMTGSVTACKVVDTNGDGIIANDPAYTQGWSMTLDQGQPGAVTQVTNENGCTTFTNVPVGAHSVTEANVQGWTRTFPASDTQAVQVSDNANTTVTFGNTQEGSINGYKWSDLNGNGQRDCTETRTAVAGDEFCEPLLQGWTITLWQGETLIDSTVTAANGWYSFSNLLPGDYTVCEQSQAGWVQTYPASNAGCHDLTLVSGQTINSAHFGNQPGQSTISGTKYYDWDHSGTFTPGDTTLANWEIKLFQGDTLLATTQTGLDGTYTLPLNDGLLPGAYTVCETQPNGWFSIHDTCQPVQVNGQDPVTAIDFFNYQNIYQIHGEKFHDLDGDGDRDCEDTNTLSNRQGICEFRLAGWTIQLWQGDTLIDSTVTDEFGQYAFIDLEPGTYRVCEVQQAGWQQTAPTTDDGCATVTLPLPPETKGHPYVSFGNQHLGTVQGYKWEDVNGNTVRDCVIPDALGFDHFIGEDFCEPLLSGWTIQLQQGDSVIATTVTDGAGYYTFTNVVPGEYTVCEVQQNGWQQTYPLNEDCHALYVFPGTSETSTNFGNIELGSISGHKFEATGPAQCTERACPDMNRDTFIDAADLAAFAEARTSQSLTADFNNDGVVNDGDQAILTSLLGATDFSCDTCSFDPKPLSDWVMALHRWNGEGYELLTKTNTNVAGYYEFVNLSPGQYRVCELIPETVGFGWEQISPTEPECYLVTIESGDHVTDRDFVNEKLLADVSVSKTDGLTTATPGQTLTYTIVVSNIGVWNADAVSVMDTLPPQATYVSSTVDAVNAPAIVAPNASGDVLVWPTIGTIPPGGSKVLQVTVTLDALFPFGATPMTNTVQVQTTSQDPNTNNNKATDTTTVNAAPTVSITKSANAATLPAGSDITWTVGWSVAGNSLATNVVITDPIPTNTTFVSVADGGVYNAGTNTITWNLGVQAPGSSGQVHAVVHTAATLPSGTVITNTATIDSVETDPPFSAQASVTLTNVQVLGETTPELSITKVASKAFTNRGDELEYTVVVKNIGDGPAVNATVVDVLPKGFTFIPGGESTMTFPLGTLAAGESKKLTYLVQVSSSASTGKHTNIATARADGAVSVTASADVSVRSVQVLGETGANVSDWMYFLAGALALIMGVLLYRRELQLEKP